MEIDSPICQELENPFGLIWVKLNEKLDFPLFVGSMSHVMDKVLDTILCHVFLLSDGFS